MKILDKIIDVIYVSVDTVASVFYPNRCASCKKIIDNNSYLCSECERDIERFDVNKRCRICGLDKEHCDCKKYIYYFDGAVSVYKNADIARNALYSYKLGRRQGYASFFASEMANATKREFADIKFDAIIGVPTTIKSRIKYGFSPVDELCFGMEEILGVKFFKNVLKCHRKNKTQHKLVFTKRFENAGKKFYCNGRVDGKTILLVDDIKTSGATLSYCARNLKFAGADKVYCVTALGTVIEKKIT